MRFRSKTLMLAISIADWHCGTVALCHPPWRSESLRREKLYVNRNRPKGKKKKTVQFFNNFELFFFWLSHFWSIFLEVWTLFLVQAPGVFLATALAYVMARKAKSKEEKTTYDLVPLALNKTAKDHFQKIIFRTSNKKTLFGFKTTSNETNRLTFFENGYVQAVLLFVRSSLRVLCWVPPWPCPCWNASLALSRFAKNCSFLGAGENVVF